MSGYLGSIGFGYPTAPFGAAQPVSELDDLLAFLYEGKHDAGANG